jgi:hypothetical protein
MNARTNKKDAKNQGRKMLPIALPYTPPLLAHGSTKYFKEFVNLAALRFLPGLRTRASRSSMSELIDATYPTPIDFH